MTKYQLATLLANEHFDKKIQCPRNLCGLSGKGTVFPCDYEDAGFKARQYEDDVIFSCRNCILLMIDNIGQDKVMECCEKCKENVQ